MRVKNNRTQRTGLLDSSVLCALSSNWALIGGLQFCTIESHLHLQRGAIKTGVCTSLSELSISAFSIIIIFFKYSV